MLETCFAIAQAALLCAKESRGNVKRFYDKFLSFVFKRTKFRPEVSPFLLGVLGFWRLPACR